LILGWNSDMCYAIFVRVAASKNPVGRQISDTKMKIISIKSVWQSYSWLDYVRFLLHLPIPLSWRCALLLFRLRACTFPPKLYDDVEKSLITYAVQSRY
jgi:hypothetical protein